LWRVVGWSMSKTMTAELVTDALVMAIWRSGKPRELLHQSDRGSQHTREKCQRLMAEHFVTRSLPRSGNVWDSAVSPHARHRAAAGWVHPKMVSERGGHSSVAFTLQRHGHALPDLQQNATDEAERLSARSFGAK
jgi:transposase InsO family protein